MILIRGPTDLPPIEDQQLRALVALRMTQLGDGEPYNPQAHGELYVAEETDTAEALEAATGVFITTNPFDGLRHGHPDFVPVCEFIEEHPACFEMVFVMSDEGAVAIFVPKHPSIDPDLTAFCTAFAVPAVD
jgi:hypothetical protein